VSPVPYETKTRLILPVKGRVLVWDGHDRQSHHRRFDYTRPPFAQRGNRTNYQRHGYDFVVVNEQGLTPTHPYSELTTRAAVSVEGTANAARAHTGAVIFFHGWKAFDSPSSAGDTRG
jgi:hypothetical protein